MKKKQPPEFQASTIRSIVQIAMRIGAENPELLESVFKEDQDQLWRMMTDKVPDLKDPARCAGCFRSMKITIYEADLHDALLILAMGREVRKNIARGMNFTEANKVHLPTLKASNATIKRQTKCDYLGLVKQQPNWRGTGYWCLTGWAYKALRGEEIPRAVKYWEGHILGRSERMTTMGTMFRTHRDLVEKALAKRAAVKADHRAEFADYRPEEWAGILAMPAAQSSLFPVQVIH